MSNFSLFRKIEQEENILNLFQKCLNIDISKFSILSYDNYSDSVMGDSIKIILKKILIESCGCLTEEDDEYDEEYDYANCTCNDEEWIFITLKNFYTWHEKYKMAKYIPYSYLIHDGHNYLIPFELKEKFEEMSEDILENEDERNDLYYNLCQNFDAVFSEFNVEGNISNYVFYLKIETNE